MTRKTRKLEKAKKFTSLTIPAEILGDRKLSGVEKHIICDIGYFVGTGREYKFRNAQIAVKLGVTRKAVFNAMVRLKSAGKIIDTGPDEYHHNLHLSCELTTHFKKPDKDKIKESPPVESAKNESVKKFQKPTSEQVAEYAGSIGFVLDGQQFVNYYEARGWKYKGNVQMKDWKAAVRYWKSIRKDKHDGSDKVSREFAESSAIGTTVEM